MSNKVYDTLKYISIYVIPSLATFVGVVGTAVGYQYTSIAVTIISATGVFIAGCLGVSNSAYKKNVAEQQNDGE